MWCLGCRCQRINEPVQRLECYFKTYASSSPAFVLFYHIIIARGGTDRRIKSETSVAKVGKEGSMSHKATLSSYIVGRNTWRDTRWHYYHYGNRLSLHTSRHITNNRPSSRINITIIRTQFTSAETIPCWTPNHAICPSAVPKTEEQEESKEPLSLLRCLKTRLNKKTKKSGHKMLLEVRITRRGEGLLKKIACAASHGF